MRKILTFLFAALMSVGMWAAPIVVEGVKIGDLYYNLNNGNHTAEVIKYQSDKYTGDIIIPESVEYYSVTYTVTSIGYEAFYGCYGLTSIEIPNSVTSIGDVAFESCGGLTSVTIGNSVTSIGGMAFGQCTSLTSITIPNSVISIGESAFMFCIGLESITIPNSVTSIGAGAFAACIGLTSMVVASGNTKYDSRDNCNAIIETSSNTLIQGCQNTIIPNGVTSIELGAFYYCYGLTSIEIPNSVISIGESAFQGCSDLTSVTIGNSVTSIGDYAFTECEGLTSITCHAVMPPTCGDEVFYVVDKSSIPLYVPSGSVAAYQAADQWEDFTNIQAIADEPAEDVDITPNADPQHASVYYSTFFDSSVKYELPAGVEAYVADLSGANLLLTKIAEAGEVIPANVAVILKSTVTPFTLTVSDAAPVTFTATNSLQGTDVAKATPANCYVLGGADGVVGFYPYSGTNLNPHKAYVVFSGSNNAPRRMPFIFDAATGVENVQGDKVQSTKVLRDGQLIIIRNGVEYNANGMMVK